MSNISQEGEKVVNNKQQKKLHLLNEEINLSPVLLVVPDGENKLMEIDEALRLSRESSLDLVLINGRSTPPIVKILDYGKFLYELKKQKGGKKNVMKVKSVTVKPQISAHDIKWKADKSIDWLKSGDKVQFIVRATGRMSDRMDLINEVYDSFSKLIENYGRSKDGIKKISKIQYATYFTPIKTNGSKKNKNED